ncbi:ABC-F family ATP-binding cassette domain-containing protein [Phaeovulum sp. W22_SRMD_FR3]|uniref:ABC-F family ATP-binding cassette domain-containing protein n=1 Tax=Phaeovulum sp. W22_SRMD_FR3 TaxID=3240274 RepID=UPI003F977626
MPALVSLSRLSWSTPDGTPLFTDLDLTFGPERTGIVGRNGTGKSTLLRLIAGELAPASGQVQVTGPVARMRQDALPHPDETIADLFGARSHLALLRRAEAGGASAAELAEADWALPVKIERALEQCGLSVGLQTRMTTLSGGQRSRAALAALMVAAPDVLLLDEPTNNLDRAGRRAVIDLIRGWQKGAIIVSHDRELLEEMDAILELTPQAVTRYGGNYTAYRHAREHALQVAAGDLAQAQQARREADRQAQRATERKARKDSAGHRARAKGDQPKILMDAAKGRAEASGGAGLRLRKARRAAADAAVCVARAKVEVLQSLRMEIPPTGLLPGKSVLRLDGVTGGHDPLCPVIRNMSLQLTGAERVVIAGPNGSGKTTLLNLVTGQIAPHRGTVEVAVGFALLDQHLGCLAPAQSLQANFRRLNPAADAHLAHATLARFGFRAQDALRPAGDLSGGARVRAGLACVLGAVPPPALLLLDEPTNHLDLEGIAALEAALASYDGALLVVSHDARFLAALAADRTVHLGP